MRMYKRREFRVISVIVIALSSQKVDASDGEIAVNRSRAQFVTRIQTLQIGMTMATVEAALGKPDSIRQVFGANSLWCYGVSKPHELPTLGSVEFDEDQQVIRMFGQGKSRIDSEIKVTEAEIRRLLSIIDAIGGVTGETYNPLAVIQVVNSLIPAGKESALQIVDEYVRVVPDIGIKERGNALIVLRVLFATGDKIAPDVVLGHSWPRTPRDPKTRAVVPLFPVFILDDIPLMLTDSYVMAGRPIDPRVHIDLYRNEGSLRTRPLAPTKFPIDLLREIEETNVWQLYGENPDRGRANLAAQLLKLSPKEIVPIDAESIHRIGTQELLIAWRYARNSPRASQLRWSERLQAFSVYTVHDQE